MAVQSNLIHSGLPWASPQKIAIGSSQYISNAIINRALLHLLNNEYYLDIKSQAINNYIEQNVIGHMMNEDIHVSWSRIQNLLSSLNILTEDIIYYIPLMHNGTEVSPADINDIISKIPKNLNGYTVVLYFCNTYSDDDKREILTISKNLYNKSILVDNFIGGDVILYSNSSKNIKIKNYTDINNLKASSTDQINIFRDIQNIIDNKNISTNKILIKSTGFNENYSAFAIKNCLSNVYLINMAFTNTISEWSQAAINEIINNVGILPSLNTLLIFYPMTTLIAGNKFQYSQKYLNKTYLNNNATYYLYSNTNIEHVLSSGTDINLSTYMIHSPTEPQYLSFDSFLNTAYPVSNQLRQYIYNWNGNNQNFTLAFIGQLSENMPNNNHPIFSDYNSIGNQFGLYVYLNKIYSAASLTSTIDYSEYSTDFNMFNKDMYKAGLFIIQFIHNTELLKEINTVIPSSINHCPISDGNMRINILFYPLSTPNNCIILSPNASLRNKQTTSDDNTYLINTNYQFRKPLPTDFDSEISIKLFANKRISNGTELLKNWDYYSGSIKNILLFNKVLSHEELTSIASKGKVQYYDWISQIEQQAINNITLSSYLGALNIENNKNINLINVDIKTNG